MRGIKNEKISREVERMKQNYQKKVIYKNSETYEKIVL